jgi:hypothetical protein
MYIPFNLYCKQTLRLIQKGKQTCLDGPTQEATAIRT